MNHVHIARMTSVISFVALVATPLACSQSSPGAVEITREPDRPAVRTRAPATGPTPSPAPKTGAGVAADALYWFLTDGEDGCSCNPELQSLTRSFQRARNAESLAKATGSPTDLLATDGYLDPATAAALATYSGHWLPPCYGAWNARCGPAPRASTGSVTRVVGGSTAGGCWQASLREPGGAVTCDELRTTRRLDASALDDLRVRSSKACGDAAAPQLIHHWVYNAGGCPKPERVAACRSVDGDDPRVAKLEWFYDGTVADIGQRCRASGGTVVLP